MARKAPDTPFTQRMRAAGVPTLSALRAALSHGADTSTTSRWAHGRGGTDSVEALFLVAAMLPPEQQAEVWRPIDGLSRDTAAVVRLLDAFDMLGKADKARALEQIAKFDFAAVRYKSD